MSQQPKSHQKEILKMLTKHGVTEGIYWCPEGRVPPRMRRGLSDDGYTMIGYPGHYLPVVPVGKDPEASRRYMAMLCDLFRLCMPHLMEIEPVLASDETLLAKNTLFYHWTDEIMLDVTCASCGAIEQVLHTVAEDAERWLCCDCVDSKHCNEFIAEYGVDGFRSARQ